MNLITKAKKLKQFRNDPIGYIIDKLIEIAVNLIIPIPWAGKIIAESKGFVLGCLASLIVLSLLIVTVLGSLFMSPLLFTSGFFQKITAMFTVPVEVPFNPEFISTAIPRQNPFGGHGMGLTSIAAYFQDPAYFIRFGRNHTGIDLVPNQEYFKESKSYQETKQVVVYATMNGKVRTFVDQYGGETVEITNDANNLKTIFIHFSKILADTGQTIKAGVPIGIMGKTGLATGEHVHYEIRAKDGTLWRPINPLPYIK